MKQLGDIKTLSELSSSQWGMFTTAQAIRSGVTRRQLSELSKKGHIERIDFGAYHLEGAPTERFSDIKAAWISIEPQKYVWERLAEWEKGIVVGGHTAANLYEVGDLWPSPFLFMSQNRKQTRKEEITFRKFALSRNDVTLIEGLPVTSPELTIATLASESTDLSHIETVVSDLYKIRSIDEKKLAVLLSPYSKKYGFGLRNGKAFTYQLLWHAITRRLFITEDSQRQLRFFDNEMSRDLIDSHMEQLARISEGIKSTERDV